MDGIEALVSFADPIQQSKPMKTISISFLILVAFPIHLMAQDFSPEAITKPKVAPSYFTYSPVLVEDNEARHIVQPVYQSNRKGASTQLNLSSLASDNSFKPPAVRVAKLPTEPLKLELDAKVEQMSRFQVVGEQVNEVIAAPKVSAAEFGMTEEIVRPTPDNSNPIVSEPPQPIQPPVNNDFRPATTGKDALVFTEESMELQEGHSVVRENFSVPAEPVSLDDLQMSQRFNSWEEKPNTMRDIVDHFSPGGEPFAQRGIVDQRNLFGVDRRTCCDEWSGVCDCRDGLTTYRNNLGAGCHRKSGNCKGCGQRHARRATNGCGCPSCCK